VFCERIHCGGYQVNTSPQALFTSLSIMSRLGGNLNAKYLGSPDDLCTK
jgi:hypothetical protein